MHVIKKPFLLLLPLFLGGCYLVSFEDVTNVEPYSQYASKTYISTQITYIDLISMDKNYKPNPSEYVIRDQKMAKGPEVLSQGELPPGATFTVVQVLRCKNCYLDFSERIKLKIQLINVHAYKNSAVTISDKLLGSVFVDHDAANQSLKRNGSLRFAAP